MIYTLDDIKQFLDKNLINWKNYNIFAQGEIRPATIEDFETNSHQTLRCIRKGTDDYCRVEVSVSPYEFLIFDEGYLDNDLSDAWSNFLLNKYGNEYKKYLYIKLENDKNKTRETYGKSIASLQKKLEQKTAESEAKLEKISTQQSSLNLSEDDKAWIEEQLNNADNITTV